MLTPGKKLISEIQNAGFKSSAEVQKGFLSWPSSDVQIISLDHTHKITKLVRLKKAAEAEPVGTSTAGAAPVNGGSMGPSSSNSSSRVAGFSVPQGDQAAAMPNGAAAFLARQEAAQAKDTRAFKAVFCVRNNKTGNPHAAKQQALVR